MRLLKFVVSSCRFFSTVSKTGECKVLCASQYYQIKCQGLLTENRQSTRPILSKKVRHVEFTGSIGSFHVIDCQFLLASYAHCEAKRHVLDLRSHKILRQSHRRSSACSQRHVHGVKPGEEHESKFRTPKRDQVLHRFLMDVPDERAPCVVMN
jgi:hypothetical protein